jgi:hypothetical protein
MRGGCKKGRLSSTSPSRRPCKICSAARIGRPKSFIARHNDSSREGVGDSDGAASAGVNRNSDTADVPGRIMGLLACGCGLAPSGFVMAALATAGSLRGCVRAALIPDLSVQLFRRHPPMLCHCLTPSRQAFLASRPAPDGVSEGFATMCGFRFFPNRKFHPADLGRFFATSDFPRETVCSN